MVIKPKISIEMNGMRVKGIRTFMLVFVEVVETAGVEAGRTADDSMYLIAFLHQQFRPIWF
jgi:hypothetical protein